MLLEEFPFEPGFRLIDGDLLNKTAAEPAYSVDNSVTATGTTQDTAYAIRATVTSITAGGDHTGVRLPFPKVGRAIYIMNYTATPKKIYPFDIELINNSSFADLDFSQAAILICTGSASWMAAVVGADTLSGDIILDAADADTPTGDGHFVQIEAGAGGTTSGMGGAVTILAGDAAPGSLGGPVTIHSGRPGDAPQGGENYIDIASADTDPNHDPGGTYANSTSGSVAVRSGDTDLAASGDVSLSSGRTNEGPYTGIVAIFTGEVTALPSTSGQIFIYTGQSADNSQPCNSGNLTIHSGMVLGSGKAGDVVLAAGMCPIGTPGTVTIGGQPDVSGQPPGLFPSGPVDIMSTTPVSMQVGVSIIGDDPNPTLRLSTKTGSVAWATLVFDTQWTQNPGQAAAITANRNGTTNWTMLLGDSSSNFDFSINRDGVTPGDTPFRIIHATGAITLGAATSGPLNILSPTTLIGPITDDGSGALLQVGGSAELIGPAGPSGWAVLNLFTTSPVGGNAVIYGGRDQVQYWGISVADSTAAAPDFGILRQNAGGLLDSPLHISNVTGAITWGSTVAGTSFQIKSPALGFYNAAPVAQGTVTGSRGGNAALASLLTTLAGTGLFIDGSTA